MNFVKISSIDKSNMRQVILDFPKQFRGGLEMAKDVKVTGKFNGVLICGIGGSALPGEVLNTWLNAHKIPLSLYINRNYGLPPYANQKYLTICISYSGNTEETISCFNEARRKKLKIVGIASGGKLEKLCQKYKIPLVRVPQGYQPRMALGFQFAALMKILSNSGLIKDNLKSVLALEKSLKPERLEIQGRALTKKIKNRIPLIYTSDGLKTLAQIWKIKLNENSEIPAFCNYFPELNHNEMVGLGGNEGNLHMIILRDSSEHPRILKRMKLMAETFKPKRIQADFVEIKGKDILDKIFSNILLGDWTSYYLALERGIDPTPVEINDQFKKKMIK